MRLSTIWLGAFLFESLLSTAACRRETKPPPQVEVKAPAATKPAAPAVTPATPATASEGLTQVMQKGLPTSGFRIDAEGKYAGAIVAADASKCDVWRLEEGAYAGQVTAARCQDWPEYTFLPLAEWDRDKLELPATRIVHSPDGKLRAQARKNKVEISEILTDKPIATLPLVANDEVLIDTLRWGARGLVFITDITKRGQTLAHHAVYHFRGTPLGKPQISLLGGTNRYSRAALIDPTGRYVFVAQHIERVGDAFHVIDLPSAAISGLSQPPPRRTGSAYGEEESKFEPGQWKDATRPYFETLEKITSSGGDDLRTVTWRILAAPGDRRVLRIDPLRDADTNPQMLPPRTMNGKVMTEQAASTLKQQFVGVRFDTLRRVSDGEELTITESGCANSKRGAYSCSEKQLKYRVYLLGNDPLSSPMIRGTQIAALMHDPQLIEHFFDGTKLPPRELPHLGAPPRIEVRNVKYAASPERAIVEVLVHDGGDGVSNVRVLRDGVGQNLSVPAVAEKPLTLTIPVIKAGIADPCEVLRIDACNRAGHLCSLPQLVQGCKERSQESRTMEGQEISLEDLED